MYAVIKTGGKQYKVASGDTLKIETVAGDVGSVVEFGDVLMMVDGDTTSLGDALKGALVKGEIVSHGRGKKIRIVKHRRRKHYHKEQGHRQNYTEVKFTELLGGAK